MSRVALISSQTNFRQNFLEALSSYAPTTTVSTAQHLDDFLQSLSKRSKFDYIFVDAQMQTDLSLLTTLSKRFACTELIALVAEETPEHTYQCLRAGASGYLHRDSLDLLPLFFEQSALQKAFSLKKAWASFSQALAYTLFGVTRKSTLVPRSF
jgi:DNA-binding NarL/FixJ family response regulator